MAISGMSATDALSSAVPQAAAKGSKLGKDDFLKLLVTQLRYQDPMKPMEDKEFVAQLAQFSALEQMHNINQNTMLNYAMGLEGKSVVANDDQGQVVQGLVDRVRIQDGNVLLRLNQGVGKDGEPIYTEVAPDKVQRVDLQVGTMAPTLTYAMALLGKHVQYMDDSGKALDASGQPLTGTVATVGLIQGRPVLHVDNGTEAGVNIGVAQVRKVSQP